MKELLGPIRKESLRDLFVARFEELILSGRLSIGQRLPSERELALRLGVSRPVVHDGLMELVSKGLVSMKPRVGTVVNDYRKHGSLAILSSLVNFNHGRLDPRLLESMLEVRMLVEVETARLAALRRKDEHLGALQELLAEEERLAAGEVDRIVEADFRFHHLIALAAGNLIYPLLLNSFRKVYSCLAREFFSHPSVLPEVLSLHRDLVLEIERQDHQQAMGIMRRLLTHGSERLESILRDKEGESP